MDKFNYLKEQLAAALATWQQTNGGKTTVGWMHAANPEVVSDLLAELEAKDDALRAIAFHVSAGGYTADMRFDDFPACGSEREAALKLADWMQRLGAAIEDHWSQP
ncbi:hypothetical protein [Serratia sp. Nf2]|uniref:hypothetical protein n=1 Tax=Serratia sp. Nf2 TaxID=2116540 RepID=UPI000D156EAF|nr:hypothetical protein [Serratia sp. Nf2]PTA77139.1 hypothetical protein C9411_13305 [Serratia sp. Nf2]